MKRRATSRNTRRKTMRISIPAALLVAAASTMPAIAADDTLDARRAGERDLEAVVERLNAVDQWLTEAGESLVGRQRALDATEQRIAHHAARVRDLDSEVARLRAEQEETAAESRRLTVESNRLATRIADHLRVAWRLAGRDVVKQMLNQEDPAEAGRHSRYHGYLAKARARDVAALRETQTAVAEHSARLAVERQALQRAQADLDESRADLLAERGEQQRLVAGLRSDMVVKRRQRDALVGDRERLEALLQELVRQAELAVDVEPAAPRSADAEPEVRAPDDRHGQADLRWPVPGELIHSFGDSRASGHMRWQGVYLSAPLGTDILAAASGTVAFADWLRGFGMLSIIDHGDATMSLYGHADTLYKKTGDRVEGGEPIASVGKSGGMDDVGVYFEIRRDGEPVDPQEWLQSRP